MIERLIDWSVSHRYIVTGLYLVLTGVGIWAISTTPLDAIPDLSENQVIVFSEYMGRSPQIVENQITFPLVNALQGLARVKAVRAQSMFGMSFIYVIFEDDVELYWARTRVLERLSTVQADLPSGSKTQLGPDGTGVGHVFWYTLEGAGYDLGTLRAVQDWYIKPLLQSVEGVAEVASAGGFVKQYQVNIDPFQLRTFGLTVGDVSNAVMQANNDVGGKILEVSDRENFVRGQGYITSLEDIERIVLVAREGVPLTIGEVAHVTIGPDIRRGSLEKDGKGEVTGGIIVMRFGENAKEVIDAVKAKIETISPGLPQGVKIVSSYDRSDLIEASIKNLAFTLVEEALIVTLVVMLFLFHLPSALRIIIEIPISVLIAFILMRMFGISSNIMSLGGIAIGIGVLVDASIVLLENAHRHLADAQQRKELENIDFSYSEVVVVSVKQVARPIFFSILIMVTSFLAVFMLTGQEGKLFHPLAFTKTFSLLGSAIVSITLVPVLMMLTMRGRFQREEKNPVSRVFIRLYMPVIKWALKYRKTAIGLNIFALVLSIPLALGLGSEFMPPLDEGSLLFMPTMLPSISMHEATRIMKVQDAIIKAHPEVKHVLGKVGKAETSTDPAPVSMIETIILLKDKSDWRSGVTKDKIIEDLNGQLQMPGVALGWTQPIINRINMLSTGVRTDLGIKIFGSNLDTLEQLAVRAEQIVKKIPGAADVVAERTQGGSFLDIQIDHQQAAKYGISSGDINAIVEGALGGNNVTTVVDGRQRFPVSVRLMGDYRSSLEEIKRIPIPVRSVAGTNDITRVDWPSRTQMNESMAGSAMPTSNSISGMPRPTANMESSAPLSSSSAMSSGSMGSNPAMPVQEAMVGGNMSGDGMSMSGGPTGMEASTVSRSRVRSLLSSGNTVPFIPLGAVATVSIEEGPPMIASENGLLRSIVYLNVRGRDMGGFVQEAMKTVNDQLVVPAGYTIIWSGQYEQQQHAKERLMIMVPIVIILIFFLLYITLKDLKEASTVMLSVPFALIGGVYLIAIMDYNWSVAVWVGFIALYGVAVQTGVVMVVYLHEALDRRLHSLRASGIPLVEKDVYDATIEGSALRLRPKIMTVATGMIGLIPILWSSGVGSDVMKPIAAPMVGGLLTSAVHVLIVTPVIFYLMKRAALRKGNLRESNISGWMKH